MRALSKREAIIFSMADEGRTYKEIGAVLNLSVSQISRLISRMVDKGVPVQDTIGVRGEIRKRRLRGPNLHKYESAVGRIAKQESEFSRKRDKAALRMRQEQTFISMCADGSNYTDMAKKLCLSLSTIAAMRKNLQKRGVFVANPATVRMMREHEAMREAHKAKRKAYTSAVAHAEFGEDLRLMWQDQERLEKRARARNLPPAEPFVPTAGFTPFTKDFNPFS